MALVGVLFSVEKDAESIGEKKYETWILLSWQHLNCSMKFMDKGVFFRAYYVTVVGFFSRK